MEYAKITERLKNKRVIKTVMKRAKVYIKNNKEFQKKNNNKKYLLGMSPIPVRRRMHGMVIM